MQAGGDDGYFGDGDEIAGDDGDGEDVSDVAGDDDDDGSDGDDDGSNGDDDGSNGDGTGTSTNDCTGDSVGFVCSLVLVLEMSQSPKCQCTDTPILCK